MQKILSSPSDVRLLFLSCWITYFLCYIGRINYSIIIVEIVGEGMLTKPQAGLISTGAFFAYGTGQLFSGFLSGKLLPKRLMLIGIAGSALCNLGMFFARSHSLMLCLWILNGFSQSLMWAPIMKMFSEYLSHKDGVRANTHFASCGILSMVAAAGLCSLTVSLFSWQYIFLLSSVLILIAAVVFSVGITKTEQRLAAVEDTPPEQTGQEAAPVGKFNYKALFATPVFLIILFVTVIQGILKDGVSTWIPTLLSERFHVVSYLSILVMAILPLTNLAGIYAAPLISEKIFKNEVTAAALFFAVAGFSAAGALLLKSAGIIITVLLLSLLTSSVAGINLILVGFIPLRFSKWKIAAVLSGFINFMTYFGSAISGYGFGSISTRSGWDRVILLWLGLAGAGCLMFLVTAKFSINLTSKLGKEGKQ